MRAAMNKDEGLLDKELELLLLFGRRNKSFEPPPLIGFPT